MNFQKLADLRNEIMMQSQHLTRIADKSEQLGSALAIHELVSHWLRGEGVVLPCQAEDDPAE